MHDRRPSGRLPAPVPAPIAELSVMGTPDIREAIRGAQGTEAPCPR